MFPDCRGLETQSPATCVQEELFLSPQKRGMGLVGGLAGSAPAHPRTPVPILLFRMDEQ